MLWVPKTEADLEKAISDRTLREGQHLEVKSKADDPKTISKTVAALSVEGGVFILGVSERLASGGPKNGLKEHYVDPQPLIGLDEKVNNVASRIDPPVKIRTHVISSTSDPSKGYLVVEVPKSPSAPHMAEDRYWQRRGSVSMPMRDQEVRMHHNLRGIVSNDAQKALDRLETKDPIAAINRKMGHVYLIAEPAISLDPEKLSELLQENDGEIFSLIHASNNSSLTSSAYPAIKGDVTLKEIMDGKLLCTPQSLTAPVDEQRLLKITISKSGGIGVLIGRGVASDDKRYGKLLMDRSIIGHTQILVNLVAALSQKCDYDSNWSFGMKVIGLKGAVPASAHESFGSEKYPLEEDAYTATSIKSIFSIQESPEAVTKSLVDDLVRVLHIRSKYPTLYPTLH